MIWTRWGRASEACKQSSWIRLPMQWRIPGVVAVGRTPRTARHNRHLYKDLPLHNKPDQAPARQAAGAHTPGSTSASPSPRPCVMLLVLCFWCLGSLCLARLMCGDAVCCPAYALSPVCKLMICDRQRQATICIMRTNWLWWQVDCCLGHNIMPACSAVH